MIMRKRAETDTTNPPGQMKYPEENSYRHGPARPKRLGDYIKQVQESEERTGRLNKPKLSFDEWWKTASFPWMDSVPKHWFEAVWKAAQVNMNVKDK